jgi:hypothetical protein
MWQMKITKGLKNLFKVLLMLILDITMHFGALVIFATNRKIMSTLINTSSKRLKSMTGSQLCGLTEAWLCTILKVQIKH